MTKRRARWYSRSRIGLTLLYAGAFFLAGAALVVVMYFLLGQALDRQFTARVGISEHLTQPSSNDPASQQRGHDQEQAIRAQFQKDRDNTLNAMLVASLAALGAVGVIAGGFGWLLAGRVLHPLQDITPTARRVAHPNLPQPTPL